MRLKTLMHFAFLSLHLFHFASSNPKLFPLSRATPTSKVSSPVLQGDGGCRLHEIRERFARTCFQRGLGKHVAVLFVAGTGRFRGGVGDGGLVHSDGWISTLL